MTSIVLTVCEEFGITKEMFFGPARHRDVSRARQEAVGRLRKAGLSICGIAAATKLSTSTVTYWLSPDQRDSRRAKMKERSLRVSRERRAKATAEAAS